MQQTAHTRDNKTALGQEIPARGGDTQKMKKTLLFTLALVAIPPVALEAQDPFELSVSEYMEMDDAERYAFNGYVIGIYQMSTPQRGTADFEAHRQILNCLSEWRTKSPDSWLLALNGWMYDAVRLAHSGSTEAQSSQNPAIQVVVRAILQTCASP